jgi:hypothetical protein
LGRGCEVGGEGGFPLDREFEVVISKVVNIETPKVIERFYHEDVMVVMCWIMAVWVLNLLGQS